MIYVTCPDLFCHSVSDEEKQIYNIATSISRVLRGGSISCTDLNGSDGGRSNHSIDGILGRITFLPI
jgi:hypothetical protein